MTDHDPNAADPQRDPPDASRGPEQPELPPGIKTTASAVMRILTKHRTHAVAIAAEHADKSTADHVPTEDGLRVSGTSED